MTNNITHASNIIAAADAFHGASVGVLRFIGRHAVPLLALSPAAYITYQHMVGPMGYDPTASGVMSCAVEILGYVVVDTAIQALTEKRYIIAGASFASFGGYIIVVVSVNTLLNVAKYIFPQFEPLAHVIAEGVLVLLSVPAFIWAASRAALSRLEGREKETAADTFEREQTALDNQSRRSIEAMQAKAAAKVVQVAPQVAQVAEKSPQVASKPKPRIDRSVLLAALLANKNATQAQLGTICGVSGSAVGDYIRNHGGRDAILSGVEADAK